MQPFLYENVYSIMKNQQRGRVMRTVTGIVIFITFLLAVVIRIVLINHTSGYAGDQQYFINWMQTLRLHGLGQVYAHDRTINYPPVFVFILSLYDQIIHFLGIRPTRGSFSIRFPSLLIDLVALLFFVRMFPHIEPGRRMIAFVFLALNPALIVVGPVWGQIDMLHSFLMVTTLYMLGKRNTVSGILFALALLTKFQAIIIAPIIGIYLLRQLLQCKAWKRALAFFTGFIAMILIVFSYFYIYGTLNEMLAKSYMQAVDTYPYLSLNAMNIWYHFVGTDPMDV